MRWAAHGLGVLVLVVLAEVVLGLPGLFNDKLVSQYSRDLPVMVAVLVLASGSRWARGWTWLCTGAWMLVLVYELTRAVGMTAMNQEPLLYDVFFLAQHLAVLLRDLMGTVSLWIWVGTFSSLVILVGLGHLALRWIARITGEWSWRQRVAVLCVMGIGVGGVESRTGVLPKDTLADLRDNIAASMEVYDGIARGVDASAYADIARLVLKHKPSVHIYIIESYGAGILAAPIQEQYFALRQALGDRLLGQGWSIVTGRSVAPVMGGRSWLADASLLSGRRIKHESVYRHLTSEFASLQTLPGFFSDQGYRTVLMRQNNKARPGVSLVNHFAFSDTVFFDDIGYTGQPYGWAEVPDQYALGHLREVVLPRLGSAPTFVFAHLGTSHIPWDDIPPVMETWRDLAGDTAPVSEARVELTNQQIQFQMRRFKRSDAVRLRRLQATDDNYGEYLEAIAYSFEVVVQHIEQMSKPPDLIVIMGDHQPPLYRRNTNFTVPVHVLAKDRALLMEFRKRRFREGMRMGKQSRAMNHEGFFSVMARTLARAQGLPLPGYRSKGIGMQDGSER